MAHFGYANGVAEGMEYILYTPMISGLDGGLVVITWVTLYSHHIGNTYGHNIGNTSGEYALENHLRNGTEA